MFMAGLLPAAALTVAVSAAAQAVATADQAPAVGTDHTGNEYLFWENSNQGLETATYTDANGWGDPHAVTVGGQGVGPLGSEPTVAVNYQTGDQYVFWESTGATPQLMEAYNNSTGWHGPYQVKDPAGNGMGPLASRPSAVMNQATGHEYIYWKSTVGNLQFTWWNGSNFDSSQTVVDHDTRKNISGLGSQPYAATVAGESGDYTIVVWESPGSSQQLDFITQSGQDANFPAAEAVHTNGTSTAGLGPLGSQPAVAVQPCAPCTGATAVWMNTNNDLEYSDYLLGGGNPGFWSSPQAAGVGPLNSAPAITWGTSVRAYWRGTNGHLWMAYHASNASTWNGPFDQGIFMYNPPS